jgi:hypothetical protein
MMLRPTDWSRALRAGSGPDPGRTTLRKAFPRAGQMPILRMKPMNCFRVISRLVPGAMTQAGLIMLAFGLTAAMRAEAQSTQCCTNCNAPYPISYTNTVVTGENFLADNLCQGTNNTLDDVLSGVPDGTEFFTWNQTLQSYGPAQVYEGGAWYDSSFNPSTNTLVPGEGFVLDNTSGAPFTLVIQGCAPTCPPPCSPPTNQMSLVGLLGLGIATWTNLFSCPPPCGAQVLIWNGAGFNAYNFVNGSWTPHVPLLPPGQSAFVSVQPNTNCCTNCGNTCISMTCASNKFISCGTNWNFDLPTNIVDNCCSNYSLSFSSVTNGGPCPWVITGMWLVSDACGNQLTCTQLVTVANTTTPPAIVGCQNIYTNAGEGMNGTTVIYSVTALDACGNPATVVCVPPPGSFFPCGTNSVHCTATDACGNSNSCSFQVVVSCPCVGLSNQHFTSVTNSPGSFDYTFVLENNALVPAKYLLLVPETNCFTFSPDIVTFQPPLQPGQMTNVSVLVTITGSCGSNLCGLMSLEDSNFVTCCSREICSQPGTAAPAVQCPAPVTICAPTNGASVTLIAQASGGALTIQWFVDGALVQTGGLTLTRNFSIGAHTVVVMASDGQSTASCNTTVSVLPQPVVSIRQISAQIVVVTWTGGGTLQSSSSVTGPYSDVPGATSPYTNQITAKAMFYRVPCP